MSLHTPFTPDLFGASHGLTMGLVIPARGTSSQRIDLPAARRTDPATSHVAAEQAKEMAARHHSLILQCLREHGPMGKTGISAHVRGLDHVAVCRRLSELERAKLAQPTGKTVKSAAGRSEREWKAVAA